MSLTAIERLALVLMLLLKLCGWVGEWLIAYYTTGLPLPLLYQYHVLDINTHEN